MQVKNRKASYKVIFRADASSEIGTGHIFRCLTLASSLYESGCEVGFITKKLKGSLVEKLSEYSWINLFEIESNQSDAKQTREILKNEFFDCDLVVVDSYSLDFEWEKEISDLTKKIFVIDDLANRKHYCDYLLDYTPLKNSRDRYTDLLLKKETKALLGEKFFIARKELFENKVEKNKSLKKIISVYFGGSDPFNDTLKVANVLKQSNFHEYEKVLFLGKNFKDAPQLLKIFSEKKDFKVINGLSSEFHSIIAKSILFVSAGGVSSYERTFLGTPGLVISNAENQLPSAEALQELKCQVYMGESKNISEEDVYLCLEKLLKDEEKLAKMQKASLNIFDEFSLIRILILILNKNINLRPAVSDDLVPVYNIRNHISVRESMFDMAEINFETHSAWYKKTLKESKKELLVMEFFGHILGVIRFDETQALNYEISVYLAPQFKGLGLGALLIRRGCEWLMENKNSELKFKALVKEKNISSLQAFKSAGFDFNSDSRTLLSINDDR